MCVNNVLAGFDHVVWAFGAHSDTKRKYKQVIWNYAFSEWVITKKSLYLHYQRHPHRQILKLYFLFKI